MRMVVAADQPADIVVVGDVGGLEGEHPHDGVERGWRHGRVLLERPGDVLPELSIRPVARGRPDDREPFRQEPGFGELRLMIYGAALTLVVLFMPGGIVQAWMSLRHKARR